MAVLKSLIVKGGRKQIGGIVLYNRKGETIARELAAQVSNPRTPDQMQQRVRLANLVAVYRANRAWMKGAFEDKKERESDYNAFVSNNMANTKVAMAKSEVDAGAAVVGPYKITSGSLPVVECTLNGNNLTTNINLGNFTITGATTVGEFAAAVIGNNNGITAGMQLSVIVNLQQAMASSGVPYITVRAYEVILNTEDETLLSDLVPDSILSTSGSTNKVLVMDTTNLGDGAGAFILSHSSGGTTRVSSQSLVFFGSNATYRSYTSDAAWNRAMASYGESETSFLNSNSSAAAQSVVTTLSLLGVDINDRTYTAGQTLAENFDEGDGVDFNFNRSYGEHATVSAYYTIGASVTKYQLTNIEEALDHKSFTAYLGSTQAIPDDNSFTLVAVVDGDEYPISLRQHGNGSADE